MANPLTRAEVIAVLKEVYGDFPYEQMNHEARILAMFNESETFTWEGDIAVENLHVSRNYSTKAVAEGGRLPTPQSQGYLEMRVPMRYVYGGIHFTAQVMKTASTNRAAFLNVMEGEVNGMVRDMLVEVNRIMWGDGRGVLALVDDDATGGETDLVIDAPMGIAGAINGARFIRTNMVLAFHAAVPSDNVPLAVRTVTAVTDDGLTITIASVDETEAPNNGIITKGVTRAAVSEGSFNLEPMGLLGLVDDGSFVSTIHSVDRTTPDGSIFEAQVLSGVGSLDEFVFWRLLDQCDEASGYEPDKWYCHHSIHRQYIEASIGDKRYSGGDQMRPDIGIKGGGRKHELTFSGDTIHKERHAPYGTLFGIDSGACKRYESVAGEWIDEDGAILHRGAGDIDSFEGQYRMWRNHGLKRANSSCVARDIDATVDIVNAA